MFVLFAGVASAEPTELEKERQRLLEMGVDPAVLESLTASAQQTVEVTKAVEDLNTRLAALRQALALRPEVAACVADAGKRLGAPLSGAVTWTITLTATGAVGAVEATAREGNVDDVFVACVADVIRQLPPLPGDAEHTGTIRVDYGPPPAR